MNELRFVDTTLRDGQMSLWATNMTTAMMLPVLEPLDDAGFEAIELLAAAFFKKLVRELREDPWERIDRVRERVRKTPLRAIRGRYMSAFQITPQSMEDLFVERLAAHGVREVRISDSSNTASVWASQVQCARRAGLRTIVNLIYSISPKHTDEYYARKTRAAAVLAPERLCLKDPGGLLTPERTAALVPIVLANAGDIPVEFHTHCNTGLGPLCVLEAIKHGMRSINTALPPLADGSSNPSLFNVTSNARSLGYTAAINDDSLRAVAAHFTAIAKRTGLPIGRPAPYDAYHYVHQVPGGMISNLRHQLAAVGLEGRLDEVLEETARVRADLGYPIMVTPYSQFVGSQAAMNVIAGARYKMVSDEIIQYALGLWGAEESDAMDPNVRDRLCAMPRAAALRAWRPPQPTLEEVRRRFGANLSDDELLLRYLAGEDQVAALRAAPRRAAATDPLVALVGRLAAHLHAESGYIHVRSGALSIKLERRGGRP